MQKKIIGVTVLAFAILVAVGLVFLTTLQTAVQTTQEQVSVTWGLLAEIVYRLSDGEITVHQILPPGVEIHDWEPSPDVVEKAAKSKVLLWTIEGLDDWAVSLAKAAGVRAYKVSEGVDLLPIDTHHGHAGYDIHVWLSVKNMAKIVKNTAEILEESFPMKKQKIQENAVKLLASLEQLDREAAERLKPYRGRLFITQHEAFKYFAESYGLSYRALLTVEEEEPSAAHLAEIYKLVEENGVNVVYAEDGNIHPILRSMANDLGLTIKMLYTCETLTLDEVRQGRSYLDIMRWNVNMLVEGFESK
ncbi:MAG: metal ABC transporter substrate-binding protein [Candidatus Caldarchaeum sp.]|uniref:Zinc ABC transporter substrate-binding protein n=1 Tax=Caldiarchaeum subterraneum TaxID=311458 RepID=A0A7C5QCH0_CALS0